MRLYAASSGFSYAEWKGTFYPEKIKSEEMLRYYAERLDTVEINNTFYRMPKPEVLAGWRERVPQGFVFVLKASQRITHRQKLEDSDESVAYLWNIALSLGPTLGPILFQLPATVRRDDEKLRRFVAKLPADMRAVLEVRHKSWFDEDVFRILRERGVCLCYSDTDPADQDDPGLEQPFIGTADFGYVRLRRAAYDEASLSEWVRQIRGHAWKEVFVFFKHEATAPGLAMQIRELWGAG